MGGGRGGFEGLEYRGVGVHVRAEECVVCGVYGVCCGAYGVWCVVCVRVWCVVCTVCGVWCVAWCVVCRT